MVLDIKQLKGKIDDYFEKTTKEQVHKDLIKAGWEIYSKVELNILDEQTGIETHVSIEDEANAAYLSKHKVPEIQLIVYGEVVRPRYHSKEIYAKSSNQESNEVGTTSPGSSTEDSLPWGNWYGYFQKL